MSDSRMSLGPTSPDLDRPETRAYFLWWTDVTTGELRTLLASPDPEVRAYWMGALLREANSRDVWSFVRPETLRSSWPSLVRHLGGSRDMWAWLLGLEPARWPPAESANG